MNKVACVAAYTMFCNASNVSLKIPSGEKFAFSAFSNSVSVIPLGPLPKTSSCHSSNILPGLLMIEVLL